MSGFTFGRTLNIKDHDPHPEVVEAMGGNPSTAQFQLWLAQCKRDHRDISDREMSKVELAVDRYARKSICIFNPFTGETRRVEAY